MEDSFNNSGFMNTYMQQPMVNVNPNINFNIKNDGTSINKISSISTVSNTNITNNQNIQTKNIQWTMEKKISLDLKMNVSYLLQKQKMFQILMKREEIEMKKRYVDLTESEKYNEGLITITIRMKKELIAQLETNAIDHLIDGEVSLHDKCMKQVDIELKKIKKLEERKECLYQKN